jgi:glycosyltransferase involved in cell wall biosynthesis
MGASLGDGKPPAVSWVIPCFNEKIEILIKSLSSIKEQSFVDFECIVIDESTNQEIADFCREFCKSDPRFIYFHPEKRLGLAASLNMGIEKARGVLIARFDSDDVCRLDRLSQQVHFLNTNPAVSVLGCAIEIIDESGKLISTRVYPQNHDEIEKKFIFSSALAHPAVIFRKDLLGDAGGLYDTSFIFSEDLDLWLRLLNKGVKFANLPDPLVQYRQHHTSRHKIHWKFNIKARLSNISRPYAIRKLIGVLGIAIWSYLPRDVQQFLFRYIHLGRA